MSKPDIIFKCRKCGHLMYIDKSDFMEDIERFTNIECDSCGEEGGGWQLSGEGNYDKEYKA